MTPRLTPEELEHFIHRELRALPPRRAPRSLEGRVRAALAQRAALPWYHRSWSYWPAIVRATFLGLATGLSAAFVLATTVFSRGATATALTQEVDSRLQIFTRLYEAGRWTLELVGHLFAAIPPLWLYGGLTLVAAFYVTFFGLGAFAYRTFHQHD